MKNWEQTEDKHVFALLGQYGMGKTFTCRQFFINHLVAQYEANNHHYVPFYFDLRDFDIQVLKINFTIEDIIDSILIKKREAGAEDHFTADDFFKVWKDRSCLIIIDGIDEVLPHLKEEHTESRFLGELWKLVPDFRHTLSGDEPGISRKMLLTCRTDYFKTLNDQQAFFRGKYRDNSDDKTDYEIAILKPFNDTQIKNYLSQAFPERPEGQVYGLLSEIHNLQELSQRPVLIHFITEVIEELEQKLMQQTAVNTADLYETLVDKTFKRDKGKHEIPIGVKKTVLAHIAAMLWR